MAFILLAVQVRILRLRAVSEQSVTGSKVSAGNEQTLEFPGPTRGTSSESCRLHPPSALLCRGTGGNFTCRQSQGAFCVPGTLPK